MHESVATAHGILNQPVQCVNWHGECRSGRRAPVGQVDRLLDASPLALRVKLHLEIPLSPRYWQNLRTAAAALGDVPVLPQPRVVALQHSAQALCSVHLRLRDACQSRAESRLHRIHASVRDAAATGFALLIGLRRRKPARLCAWRRLHPCMRSGGDAIEQARALASHEYRSLGGLAIHLELLLYPHRLGADSHAAELDQFLQVLTRVVAGALEVVHQPHREGLSVGF